MNKSKSKALKQLAAMLPAAYIVRNHTEQAPLHRLWELKDQGHNFELPAITEENADQLFSITYPATEILNHHKRLKRVFLEKGAAGIQEYIRWLDAHNRKWAEKMKVDQVDPGLLEIASAKISSFWKMLIAWLVGFSMFFQDDRNKQPTNP